MEPGLHHLCELFQQLGLPGDVKAVESFIQTHKPLSPDIKIMDAPFWNSAQRDFLIQSKNADADWVGLVDQLDVLLR